MKAFRRPFVLAVPLLAALVPAAGLADPEYLESTTELVSPPPLVTLQSALTAGPDLSVTLDWPVAGGPPPPSARLRLFDPDGLVVGSVDFTPGYGPQTIWIPGGAEPRPADLGIWPLGRDVELISIPHRDILLEQGFDVVAGGPAVTGTTTTRRRQRIQSNGRICSLYLYYIRMHDSEDHNGDDLTLYVTDMWPRGWREDIKATADLIVEDSFLICDTCNNVYKTIDMELVDRDDPGFPLFDPDDHLGTVRVKECSTMPWTTTTLSGSNYTYDFVYRVTCAETTCP